MNHIREIREMNKMKQADLATKLQISQGTLSNWERGIHDPDTESLHKLADIFDVSTDYLLGRTHEPKPTAGDIDISEIEYALYGEVRELDDEDKAELLRNARRLREFRALQKLRDEKKL